MANKLRNLWHVRKRMNWSFPVENPVPCAELCHSPAVIKTSKRKEACNLSQMSLKICIASRRLQQKKNLVLLNDMIREGVSILPEGHNELMTRDITEIKEQERTLLDNTQRKGLLLQAQHENRLLTVSVIKG
ncbi:hypothetical protein ALC53_04548 [Atta colombica]|uniref:Uncharacterized protein n=1 Tax=Atta colombica TaxID=520822 RepID=A0A195BKQ1_9HYME|nr:hypothetical protein ALC53_04548 [Atta colombica]